MSDPSPAETLRRSLTGTDPVLGTFVKLPGLAGVELARRSDLDFVVVDLEHSQLSEGDAAAMCTHAAAVGLPALVRLAELDRGLVNRLLEAGAAGVQLSTVRRSSTTRALRAATRHAPDGDRSISLSHPKAGWGTVTLADHLAAEAAVPPLCVGQVETATTDDPVAELAGSLDVVFVGTTDLAVDLGRATDPGAPEVRDAVATIAEGARRAGVVLGAFAASPDDLGALVTLGARYLVVGSDLALLAGAVTTSARAARAAVDRPEPS